MRIRIVAAALVLGACSSPVPEAIVTTTTAPPPTTTSTTAPTTTTVPELKLEGADPSWEHTVADVYGSVCGGSQGSLPIEMTTNRAQGMAEAAECPQGGKATAMSWGDVTLAAAEIGDDAVYGVDDGSGFQVVAARLRSPTAWPGGEFSWYGVVPKVFLAVGSDARNGEDPNSSRADSIHLVALDGAGSGGIMGIPRDSWVRISSGKMSKINSSLSTGGPPVMLQTVADVTGINLDGYVLTGFTGFQEMIGNVLGGVDIELPSPVQDSGSGADLAAGEQYLNGPQALALARARKSLSSGDLSRQLNGGLLLLAALSSAQAYGPLALPNLISSSAAWMSTDLSPAELLAFSALALDTPITGIGNEVAPGSVGTVGSASVVHLSESATDFFADLADGNLSPRP